jgi:hypothetical protein
MSLPETTPPPSAAEVVTSDVAKYGDHLLPGAAEKIGHLWQSLASLAPDKRAEKIHEGLTGHLGARWLNPEAAPAKLENGQPYSPLRQTLSRHAGELMPGAVDTLTAAWSAELARKTPSQIEGEVVRRLATRDAEPFLKAIRVVPAHEQKIVERLSRHFGELGPTGAALLARDLARDLTGKSDQAFVIHVASRLTYGPFAAKYGTASLDGSDPRLLGQFSTPATRSADGRFTDRPATPPPSKPRGGGSF